ncbi:MAG TPA: ABC transporter permease [Armatimonadaceae bacterium]|nr:ABC transporter permease [Armatimonadaceae bacterium]
MRNPLSAITYFQRNPGKTVPMVFVIVLSVFLIASIATMVNSIDLTIRTIYAYTRHFTYAIPQRVSLRVPDEQIKVIRDDPRVDRVMEGSIFFTNIKTVMGRFPFVVLGVETENREYLIKRIGTSLIEGRMPAEGMPEAVVSAPIAENKKLKVGDMIAGPTDEGGISGSPIPVRCVGILKGPVWIAFTTKSFADATFITTPKTTIFTTKNPDDLFAVNDDMMPTGRKGEGKLAPSQVQLLSYQNLVEELRDSLSSMYLIMTVVNFTVIFVISLMSGMLSNIYFTQRISEFAVLAAIGYQRSALFLRVFAETMLLTSLGWLVGALVTFVFLNYFKTAVFQPRGLFIDPGDPFGYKFTIPIPFTITAFAVATIAFRLKRLDPVTIIERR